MWRPPVVLSDRADPRSEFRAVVEVRTILTWLGAAREGASGDVSARKGQTERDKPEGGADKVRKSRVYNRWVSSIQVLQR